MSSILKEHFFRTPGWTLWVSLLVFALVAVYLVALLPRLRAGPAAMFTLAIFVILLGPFRLMMGPGIWLKLMLPAALLVIGHLLLTTKRFLMTERGKEKSEAIRRRVESHAGPGVPAAGPARYGLRQVPQVPGGRQLMDNVYNLALDFERNRQFNKAESVFAFIHQNDPKFRDVASA